MELLKSLFGSKKFIALLASILMVLLQKPLEKWGINLTEADLAMVIAAVAAYLIGQGLADKGKEAAKVEADKTVP